MSIKKRIIKVCYFHVLHPAVGVCSQCQKPICKYCVCWDGEDAYCPDCKNLGNKRSKIQFSCIKQCW